MVHFVLIISYAVCVFKLKIYSDMHHPIFNLRITGIDLLTASFESMEEKPEPHILISEKIRRLISLPLPAEIAFTEASLATIKRFAEEETLDTLIIGVAGNELIATFSSEELPQAVTNISFIVKQKCGILGVDDFISRITHFSLPMDAKSGALHLMQSTFAHNFIFDEHTWPESKLEYFNDKS
jgi:hypothetical protein